jgi:hypothetical protein
VKQDETESRVGSRQMHNELLMAMVRQNQFTSQFSLGRITEENARLRLTDTAASVGFIYRHIGETMNLFGQMLGVPTDVKNTTIGSTDTDQHYDVADSRALVERGYGVLTTLVENSSEADWLKPVDTPFFGTVARVRLFGHTLFHTSHHAGQISLTLSRGGIHRGASGPAAERISGE